MYAVGQVSLPGEGFVHVPFQEPGSIAFDIRFPPNTMFREGWALASRRPWEAGRRGVVPMFSSMTGERAGLFFL